MKSFFLVVMAMILAITTSNAQGAKLMKNWDNYEVSHSSRKRWNQICQSLGIWSQCQKSNASSKKKCSTRLHL